MAPSSPGSIPRTPRRRPPSRPSRSSRGGKPAHLRLIRRGIKAFRAFRTGWREFWSWRRIRFSRGGLFFTGGAGAIGLAAINTGNNLLYVLLGAMLGFIAISSWLSEQVIGEVRVRRLLPRGVTVASPCRIEYQVRNLRKRIPCFSLEVGEEDLPGEAFFPFLDAGGSGAARSVNRFIRRGVFPLEKITVSTSFPFGLFRKTRTLKVRGELVVWPRTDRPIHMTLPAGGRSAMADSWSAGSTGPRGEYRGLRDYRPGDDPRDIHWRTTARLGTPMVREYEQNRSEILWICLDTGLEPGDDAEGAVETAASLAAWAYQDGRQFGYVGPERTVEAGHGPGQMERVLDALARVDFHPDNPRPLPPVPRRRCVLVTARAGGSGEFGRVVTPIPRAQPPSEMEPRE